MADPAEFTARPSANPSTAGSRVLTAVHLPPAGRLAVLICLPPPVQATIALPDPSMPITGPPKASVLTLTGALHVPPGARTLAWITVAVAGPPSHATTARPLGAIATAGFSPASMVSGADQVSPLALVATTTDDSPWAPVVEAATCMPEAFSAKPWLPTPKGSGRAADQVLAACAGSATAAPVVSAISNAGSAIALRRMNRDMANPSFCGFCGVTDLRVSKTACRAPRDICGHHGSHLPGRTSPGMSRR